MKRSLLYIGIAATVLGCRQEGVRLQTGDLLFRAEAGTDMGTAIVEATGHGQGENFTHVGIAVAAEGADSVLEATSPEGVRIVPLAEFLHPEGDDTVRTVVQVRRLRDTSGVAASLQRARQLLGAPYDYRFRHGNGAYYCSELVWECYLRPDGARIFSARPMNFRAADGSMPRFWSELFARMGETVPQGEPGTNPNDMAEEAMLEPIGRLR